VGVGVRFLVLGWVGGWVCGGEGGSLQVGLLLLLLHDTSHCGGRMRCIL
jgi:hypothetical protein